MHMGHFLVEIFCDGNQEPREKGVNNDSTPCCNGSYEIGINCLECPFASFTHCPNELALSNSHGSVELENCSVGFGGDMFPAENESYWIDRWQSIAKGKISEAYQEYMKEFRVGGKPLFD